MHRWCTAGRSESDGEGRGARRGGGGSAFAREVELAAHDIRCVDHGRIGNGSRFGEHHQRHWTCRYSVRLLGQDDPVFVVVGGDQLLAVISGHPVAMGWEARSQCSQNQEQKAGYQPLRG